MGWAVVAGGVIFVAGMFFGVFISAMMVAAGKTAPKPE